MAFASATNFIISLYLFFVAKKTGSVSLYADGEHLRTDIWSSLGVLAGLILIKVTGIIILDSLIALIVALFILKTGVKISKTTLNNLLDGSLPVEDLTVIENIIKSFEQKGVQGFKDLKARRVGPSKDIEFTLLFPEDMKISTCHDFCDDIEYRITEKLGSCSISIHAEPDCPKCRK